MRWASFSLRIFCSTHAMTLIQRALCSPDVVEAPRYFEHNFWSHRKFFRATWLDAFSIMRKVKFLWDFEKSIKSLDMRWVSFSLRIFCSTHAMTLIQRALQSPDVVEAPRYFEHNFWSHRKNLEPLDSNGAHLMSKDFIDFHLFSDF